tara:strand:+ start:113 stop:325 length:213 start_codon:yes stop_codon:yes gene_type:complete
MSKEEKKSPVDKIKKGVSSELINRAQPIRTTVEEMAFSEEASPESLAYIQGELRRLSRLVKRMRFPKEDK